MGSDKKKKQESKGGLGKLVLGLVVLAAIAGGVAWFLAPETVQAQLDKLTGMFG